MSTQVATSHTVHTRAPLKVPKRPPRNDVTLAIQKFLPYAVVFLLSLIVYTSFKSPANMGEAQHTSSDMLYFVRDSANGRLQRLAELQRRSEEQGEGSAASVNQWKLWRENKAEELKSKIEAANAQGTDKARDVIAGLERKASDVKEDFADKTADAADWTRAYGEKIVHDVKEMGAEKFANTKDHAYDAIYSWKQKAGALKETSKDTAEKIQEKAAEVLETARDTVQSTIETVVEGAKEVLPTQDSLNADTLKEKLGEVKDAASDLLSTGIKTITDAQHTAQEKVDEVIESARDSVQATLESTVAGLKESAGMNVNEERATARISQAEYDLSRRRLSSTNSVDNIVEQLRSMGEEAVAEAMRKLGGCEMC